MKDQPLKKALCLDYLKLKYEIQDVMERGGFHLENKAKKIKHSLILAADDIDPKAIVQRVTEGKIPSLREKLEKAIR